MLFFCTSNLKFCKLSRMLNLSFELLTNSKCAMIPHCRLHSSLKFHNSTKDDGLSYASLEAMIYDRV